MLPASSANPGGPTPSPSATLAFGPRADLRPFLEASLVSLALGVVDILNAGKLDLLEYAVLLAPVAFGLRHAGRAWPCWPPLGAGLYLVHVAAITCGRKPPYVEADFLAARVTLMNLFPAGIGLALGVSLRLALVTFGWFPRPQGPPVRLLPRTTTGVLAAVLRIAIALSVLRWVAFDSGTVYSRGYDEGRFQQVRAGMTAGQVEAVLGPPLYKSVWHDQKMQYWSYTKGATSTSDFWRRWVVFGEGKVQFIISDYWWD